MPPLLVARTAALVPLAALVRWPISALRLVVEACIATIADIVALCIVQETLPARK